MDKGIDCLYHGDVRKIFVDSVENKLYLAGTFSQDGNCTSLNGITQWNGFHWDSIGQPTLTSNYKFGITSYKDTLYAYGNFDHTTVNEYFAKWNGLLWDTIRNGPNEATVTFLQKDNELIIGGYFDRLGNDSTFLLGKYDGHAFTAMTPYYGVPGGYSINAMAYFQDTLYVAGRFGLEPYKNYDTFAKWYENDFHSTATEFLGSVATSNIYAMAVYHNELYLGGYFRKVDGYTGNYIMKWDGHQLTEVGNGMDDIVTCMKVYNDQLFVGGSFTHAGSVTANYVARWDGHGWNSLAADTFSGSYPMVRDLNVYRDSLIICGTFTSINGDLSMQRVAKYSMALTNVGINEHTLADEIKMFPNPARSEVTIDFIQPLKNKGVVVVRNIFGQVLQQFKLSLGITQMQADVRGLSKGIYFISVTIDDKIYTKKLIIQ